MSTFSAQLEALLFFKGEPVAVKDLAKMLNVSVETVRSGLATLAEEMAGRGLTLILHDDTAMLTTSKDMSTLIEKILKEDLERDLGRAGLETLTIVLYHGPITRARIDYIRGVNSTFTLRQLMVRGLVLRTDNPQDGRTFLYKPTFELLSFLGLSKLEDLPDYTRVREELAQFEKEGAEEATHHDDHGTIPTNADTGSTNA